jgi:hypothetical protein
MDNKELLWCVEFDLDGDFRDEKSWYINKTSYAISENKKHGASRRRSMVWVCASLEEATTASALMRLAYPYEDAEESSTDQYQKESENDAENMHEVPPRETTL